MDCPMWLRNAFIPAPSENKGPSESTEKIFRPLKIISNERRAHKLCIKNTGEARGGRSPTTRQSSQGCLILSETAPSNKRRPPRGAAGHRGSHRLIQREPTGQTMTGKGTVFSVNTMEKAPLGNSPYDTFTKVGAKRGWRSERAVAKRQCHRSLSVKKSSRLLRRQTNELPGSQVSTHAWGSDRIGDMTPATSITSTDAATYYQPYSSSN